MNKRKLHIGFIVFASFLFGTSTVLGQDKTRMDKETKKLINKGVSEYNSAEYENAEKEFRKALAKDPLNAKAAYDLGLTLTEEDKNIEAARFFNKAGKLSEDDKLKDKAWFNEGNVWLQKKKYEKAIEAYKNALRNDPNDEEARYNLLIAMDKLKKQKKKNNKNKKDNKDKKDNKKQNKDQKKKDKNQENKDQNQKNKKNDKNKDQKKGKDKKDKKGDKKKDQKEEGKDKKDKQDKQGDKKKEQNKKNQSDNKQKEQPKAGDQNKQKSGKPGEQKSKLSPQQVKQLLVGLKNKEQKTQKKIQARLLKAKSKKKKTEKDW